MPLYLWMDKKTKKELQVIRSVADIELPPTDEEIADAGLELNNPEWTRKMCANKFVRGANWNYRKGGYN